MAALTSLYDLAERPEVLPFLPTNAQSFLDIGCARGGFGLNIRRRFGTTARLVGVEPVLEQANDARRHYDDILVGLFPEVLQQLNGERFDCIILNDVLEHMADPWTALVDMKEYLNQDGIVVASIPNIQYFPVLLRVLFRGRWDYVDEGILDRTHLRFFTRRTMIEMFSGAGYVVKEAQGIKFMEGGRKSRLLRPFRRILGDRAWLQVVLTATLRTVD